MRTHLFLEAVYLNRVNCVQKKHKNYLKFFIILLPGNYILDLCLCALKILIKFLTVKEEL